MFKTIPKQKTAESFCAGFKVGLKVKACGASAHCIGQPCCEEVI